MRIFPNRRDEYFLTTLQLDRALYSFLYQEEISWTWLCTFVILLQHRESNSPTLQLEIENNGIESETFWHSHGVFQKVGTV